MMRTSSDLSQGIARALIDAGADTVFGLPGGGANLDLIGAAVDAGLRFVLTHTEGSATMMAAVYSDLTGRPSASIVTRGPGAASTVNAVANAQLDRQPLLLITDAVSRADLDRIAHQRLDQEALFAPVVKAGATVGQHDSYDLVRSAIDVMFAGRPGPVHLDYDPRATGDPVVARPTHELADPAALHRLTEMWSSSDRAVIVLGGGALGHRDAVRRFVRQAGVPVLTTYRAKGLVPESSPLSGGLMAGVSSESPLLDEADLILFVGVDTVEFLPNPWPYAAPVVSIASWAEESTYLPLAAEAVGNLTGLLEQVVLSASASSWPADAGQRHRLRELGRLAVAPGPATHGLTPQQVVTQTQAAMPQGTVATVDAGAHMLPAMHLWESTEPLQALISSGLATMGFALPAAIGAALARPNARVVCFTGDGGLGMCLGDLETLVRLELPVTVVVFNDARLSLIALKAKPTGHGGESAIGYTRTDFSTVARGFGMPGYLARSGQELDQALASAVEFDGPVLIDALVDPDYYPGILSAIRGPR